MPLTSHSRRTRLRAAGHTPTTIANELGVSTSVVSRVIAGFMRSERIERHVAGLLGLALEEAFPARLLRPRRHAAAARAS
jgi:lambda repressor-like predicted transcriptional regulator